MNTADDLTEAFCAYEANMRQAIHQWLKDNAWTLGDLRVDNAVTVDVRAKKHTDSLMNELNRIRETYGSSF